MANSNLAYRSSISIGNISKSVSGLRDSISGTQGTVVRMGTALRDSNSYKLSSISKSDTLFRSRREATRRREQEDIIEASSIGGAVKRTGKVISSSTKGFLGRIFDFVGTLMIGWLINNLPTIINLSKILVDRIKKYVSIGSDAISGLSEMMLGFGGVLGGIYSNIISFDFKDSENKVSDSMVKLLGGFSRLRLSMFKFVRLFTGDLNKVFGFEIPDGDLKVDGDGTVVDETGGLPGGGASYPAGTYDAKKLTQLAKSVGMPEDKIPTMVAIALAESGGRSDVRNNNPKTGDDSYGLWQINMLGALGPERRRQYGIESNDELKDPVKNAKAAKYILERGGGLPAWSVYKNRRYEKFLPQAQEAFKKSGVSAPAQQLGRLRGGEDLSAKIGTGVKNIEITDAYGARGGDHKGIDIAAPAGTYIALRVDCRVIATQTGGNYGNVIDVWVPEYNVQLRFAHCQSFIITSGEVKAGTSFARVGSTGKSSGPHIHFEYSTKYNDETYGGSGDPSAYVGLILLTNGKSQASATVAQTNKPPAAQINIEDNKRDIAALKKEKGANIITVPAPQQPQQVASAPIMSDSGPSFTPSGDNVNTFITKKFLLDLAYT